MSGFIQGWPQTIERSAPIGLTDAGGIERAVAAFIAQLFDQARYDNETLNLIDPPLEDLERIRTLTNKIAPRVYIGAIPYTITGAIPPDALPDYPSIVVATERVITGYDLGSIDLRIFAGTFDESPNQGGRLDLLTMLEVMRIAFLQWGEDIGGVTRLCSPSQKARPIDYQMARENPLNHFFGEMILTCDLSSPQNFQRNPKWRGIPPPKQL